MKKCLSCSQTQKRRRIHLNNEVLADMVQSIRRPITFAPLIYTGKGCCQYYITSQYMCKKIYDSGVIETVASFG